MGMILEQLASLDRRRSWRSDQVEELKALWALGLPGGEIADRLGMTRGKVTGKRHSLGLPPRPESAQKLAMAINARRTAAGRVAERARIAASLHKI